jgi:hypothetical protein
LVDVAVTAQELIGLWSVDVQYGPGAQEDELLAFRPDGTGWYAFERHVLCELETFRWTFSEGLLMLTPLSTRTVQAEGKRSPIASSGALLPSTCLVLSIKPETTWDGRSLEVLRFGRPLPGETHYGLLTRDVARLDPPAFTE